MKMEEEEGREQVKAEEESSKVDASKGAEGEGPAGEEEVQVEEKLEKKDEGKKMEVVPENFKVTNDKVLLRGSPERDFHGDGHVYCGFDLEIGFDPLYWNSDGERLFSAKKEVDGVPFSVIIRKPKLIAGQRRHAARDGTDQVTVEIELFAGHDWKHMWKDLHVKWSYEFFTSPMCPEDVDPEEFNEESLCVEAGPIHSSLKDGFRHETKLGSYSFLCNPVNGFVSKQAYFFHNFNVGLCFTVHSTSFTPRLVHCSFDCANEHSDVCFKVGYKKFYANKALLSLHSDVFKTMFNSEFAEKNAKVIPITDEAVSPSDFEQFLRSIYPEGVQVTSSNISPLLHLGHMYDVQRTIKDCYDYLIRNTDDALYQRCDLALKYNYIQVWDNAIAEMLKNGIKGA